MATGWDQATRQTNHTELMNYVRGLTMAQANFASRDAREAALAMPDSPKAGYYMDLAAYCGMKRNGTL